MKAIADHAGRSHSAIYKFARNIGHFIELLAELEDANLEYAIGSQIRIDKPRDVAGRVNAMLAGAIGYAVRQPTGAILALGRGRFGGQFSDLVPRRRERGAISHAVGREAKSIAAQSARPNVATALAIGLTALVEGFVLKAAREGDRRLASELIQEAQIAAWCLINGAMTLQPQQ